MKAPICPRCHKRPKQQTSTQAREGQRYLAYCAQCKAAYDRLHKLPNRSLKSLSGWYRPKGE
jgi:hypothetical protein